MKKVLLIILGLALTYGLNVQMRYGVKLGGANYTNYTNFFVDKKKRSSCNCRVGKGNVTPNLPQNRT
jgi:hypothetical protein